jgi:signal transduction histidine kinase
MTRILLLEHKALVLHRLRGETRRSGIAFLYETAPTPGEFARLLARNPGCVVCTLDGLAPTPGEVGLSITEVADRARQAGVPLFLVGGDTREERDLLTRLSGLYYGSCRRSRLPWLPMMLERVVRESRGSEERQQHLVTATAQLQHAAEQMREVQKLAIIGRLTGSVVHEINNPLESITNLVYLLGVDADLPPRLHAYVALAEQELKRVTGITKQTLSFYRETQSPVRVDLSELLEEVLVMFARRLHEKRIEVVRRYDSEEPVLLFPGEMRQVYANLLANAIEATEAGGRIVLRIHRARRRMPDGSIDGLRLLVSDSGSGIAPEALQKLGQPFFTTKGQRGTGLGLWVSQAIVRRYKGEIQLRSSIAPGRHGTTFSIFLPLNLGPQMVDLAASSQEAELEESEATPIQSIQSIQSIYGRLRAGS